MRRGLCRDDGAELVSAMNYVCMVRRYWSGWARVEVFSDEPSSIADATADATCARSYMRNADVWVQPVRDDYCMTQWFDGKRWETLHTYTDERDAWEAIDGRGSDYRVVYADGSPVEETTAYDAYEAWRDHVRTESDILARRSRTW